MGLCQTEAMLSDSMYYICPQDPSFLLWTPNAFPVCMQLCAIDLVCVRCVIWVTDGSAPLGPHVPTEWLPRSPAGALPRRRLGAPATERDVRD